MAEGNWTVGLIIDERAGAQQQEALGQIVSGGAGGPMAHLAPLIGTFVGIETRPIEFRKDGMTCSISIPDTLDLAIEGYAGGANPEEPMYIENTGHPANARLALAKATRSHLHAFGMDWDDVSGTNNGHFAPFTWQG